jgi:electron transport complex protein RnfB
LENKEGKIMVAKVNIEECICCGICADDCSTNATTLSGEKAKVDEDKCADCGMCESSCPSEVIIVG